MIDIFSLLLSHGLLILAFWRLLSRADLDNEASAVPASAQEPPSADA